MLTVSNSVAAEPEMGGQPAVVQLVLFLMIKNLKDCSFIGWLQF
ncbi:hypothetical protein [uncultured Chryseobacterium sp.]|nr:hypothetical protein [uncultured Chryseobacterium sp.]